MSHNVIVISMSQMNRSASWGWLVRRQIREPGIDLRAFVSGSGLFQTTSQQLFHHGKYLCISARTVCLTLSFVREDFFWATTVKGHYMQNCSWMETHEGYPEFPMNMLHSQQSVPWVWLRQKAEKFVCDHCSDCVLQSGSSVAGEGGIREISLIRARQYFTNINSYISWS